MRGRDAAKKKTKKKTAPSTLRRRREAIMRIRKMQALRNETPERKTHKTDVSACLDLMYQRSERRHRARREASSASLGPAAEPRHEINSVQLMGFI